MREELHLLELADRYLEGTMSADERSAFEVRMAGSQELRELVSDQSALREGIARVHVRTVATKAYTSYRFGKWWPWAAGGAVVIGLVVTGALLIPREGTHVSDELELPTEQMVLPDTVRIEMPADSVATAPSAMVVSRVDTLFDTVYVATVNGKRVSWDSIPKGAVIVEQRAVASEEALVEPVEKGDMRALTKEEIAQRMDSVKAFGQGAPANVTTTEPMFKGGWDAMHRYLQQNIRPAKDSDASGTVVVDFLVDELGRISDVQLKQSLSEAHDKEAVRVIKGMPKWLPCKTNGKPARCRMTVPLRFGGVEKEK